jgi:hypothetical protein
MAEPLQPPEALGPEAARAIREFLVELAENPDALVEYIRNPLDVLCKSELSVEAKALLLDGNFARVQAVMSQASMPVRWLVIWIV